MKRLTLLLIVFVEISCCGVASADYLWPLPYGNELSSCFGGSRTRRYHAGLDVRTGGVIGKKVVAPEAGYISRVRTSYYGYGKAIYLQMKDGNTAVFGHLSQFPPEVEAWVLQQQIASESYKQDLYPSASQFPVARGGLVGYSGSTGVGAPHLHFEIRTPENVPINPLKFKGLEVEDTSSPRFEKFRLVGLGNTALAEALGWNVKQSFKRGSDGIYRLAHPLPCGGRPYWFAAEVVDFVSRNRWDKPTYFVELEHAGRTLYQLAYDALPFEEGYRIEIDRNFQAANEGDDYFYNFVPNSYSKYDLLLDGICSAVDDMSQPALIIARDVAGNVSRAEVDFMPDSLLAANFPVLKPDYRKLQLLLTDAGFMDTTLVASLIPAGHQLYLLIRSRDLSPKLIRVSLGSEDPPGAVDVHELGNGYYLIDVGELVRSVPPGADASLSVALHDAVGAACYSTIPCPYRYPWAGTTGGEGKLVSEDGRLIVTFPPRSELFYSFDSHDFFRIDTLQSRDGITYALYPNEMPLAKQVSYRYDSDEVLPAGAEFYADGGSKLYYLGAKRSGDGRRLELKSYTLGKVTVRTDDVAPSIRQISPQRGAVLANARPKVSCVIRDEMSGIGEDIDIRIDGRWIPAVYDFESDRVTAESYFDFKPGEHTLVIKATDKAGNTRIYDGGFTVSGKK